MDRKAPLVLTAAICGAEVTRDQSPAVPYTAIELAEESARCFAEGARVIHLHVRRPDGSPTQDRETFRAAILAIRSKVPEVIIQVSTGGAVGMTVDQRTEPLELDPEFCTLTTGTCNFGNEVFSNPFPVIEAIAARARKHAVRMEIEAFDAGFIDNALALHRKGLIPDPLHFDFVLGVPGAMIGTEDRLDFMRSTIPAAATWMVAGVGRYELPLAKAAIERGGHVRVGLEDNLFLSKGVLAKGSWELVRAAADLARESDRSLATPEEARRILSVPMRA